MVCIKSHALVQDGVDGGQVESFSFVSSVNSRIVSEPRGIKFELKIEEITYIKYYPVIML